MYRRGYFLCKEGGGANLGQGIIYAQKGGGG